jgi:hypothetical protein
LSEIKISQKYIRILSLIKNFPFKKNVLSGNISILIINEKISFSKLNEIFNLFKEMSDILPTL